MSGRPLPDYSKYDEEYLSDYKETENFDPGKPFQDIPVTESEDDDKPLPPPVIIYRKQWGAVDGGEQKLFAFPVENVIYSYTETDVCKTSAECIKLMKEMQKQHMKEGFPDIKFNFVIGGDGRVYEGTGWFVRSPFNQAYPDLEGETIELAHTGRRGKDKVPPKNYLRYPKKWMNGFCFWYRNRPYVLENFPEPEKVDLINSLYDFGIATGKIAPDARVCIDYMWDTY